MYNAIVITADVTGSHIFWVALGMIDSATRLIKQVRNRVSLAEENTHEIGFQAKSITIRNNVVKRFHTQVARELLIGLSCILMSPP